jgi:hypothetical protein
MTRREFIEKLSDIVEEIGVNVLGQNYGIDEGTNLLEFDDGKLHLWIDFW